MLFYLRESYRDKKMTLALKKDVKYTYGDYLKWPQDERWEIIEGRPFNMGPAPVRKHQGVITELSYQLQHYFKDNKDCLLYIAPFDVRLRAGDEAEEKIETVVQPDLSVICDQKKLDDKGCIGAPDLVIEILSPWTAAKDVKEKFDLYEKHEVKEYWILHPEEKFVEIFFLDEKGRYGRPKRFSGEDNFPVELFPGLEIDLAFLDKL